ncbi:MFS transporter [Mucilaginibacter corticis]|uniref:MFS transporter n=1 Tax=Mucilaginibacter corticis TaxID=2597670 RepID=A0A556MRW3_9SPHI|nr:MFS transporter [Mucilaginibacter corticis]TSJ42704.1 MFS transporter [Mucilaginibacter corticis]
MPQKPSTSIFQLAVIVSALGFFVDTYDLLLFAIIRKPSLASLGLNPAEVLSKGELLISIQMIGMVIGGIIFGILGDKKGRLKVLFGSILLYSIANILNGMVVTLNQYILLRFIAGVGLAGELGAGITLVSELLPKEKRSTAAGFIAGFGLFGVVAASMISKMVDWRACYYVGGALGLILLLMRIQVQESTLFKEAQLGETTKGNFLMFFNDRNRFAKYMQCILIGLPVWYIIGILVTFSDQFGKAMGINGVEPGFAIMYLYMAIAAGDFSVGWLSQRLRSRKKTLFIFYGIAMVFTVLYFLQHGGTPGWFYFICAGLGYGAGLNVVYITSSVEQFGTNLRASAGISIPNMVRGTLPLMILLFKFTRELFGNYLTGGWVTGLIIFVTGITAAWLLDETYGKDLEFTEV